MKSKITQVHPVHHPNHATPDNADADVSSYRDKTLELFRVWELVYRLNGVYLDWPGLRGRCTSLRNASVTCRMVTSVHSAAMLLLSLLNCARYAPYLINFSGLTSETSVILLFLFVFASAVWHYVTHLYMMARDFPPLAEGLARVFQGLGTAPKLKRLRLIVGAVLSSAVLTWAVSTVPLYLQAVGLRSDVDGGENVKSVRLLPAQPGTIMYTVVMYAYAYVSFFMYSGFFTLVAYTLFFCYVVGCAFAEVTRRLREMAMSMHHHPANEENNDALVDQEFEIGPHFQQLAQDTHSHPEYDCNCVRFGSDANNKSNEHASQMSATMTIPLVDVSDVDTKNRQATQYFRGSTINAVRDLLDVSDELELEILHLHHSSTARRSTAAYHNAPRPIVYNELQHPSRHVLSQNPMSEPSKKHTNPTDRKAQGGSRRVSNTASRQQPRTLTVRPFNEIETKQTSRIGNQIPEDHSSRAFRISPELLRRPRQRRSSQHVQPVSASAGETECEQHAFEWTCDTTQNEPEVDSLTPEAVDGGVANTRTPLDSNNELPKYIRFKPSVGNTTLVQESERHGKTKVFGKGEKVQPAQGKQLCYTQKSFGSEIEYLRHHHLKLIECVRLADSVLGSVVFTVYWEGTLMACFAMYSLVLGAFPSSEYFTLCISLLAVAAQILCCTSAGALLNRKAHEQEGALLQFDVFSLTERDFRSVSVFLCQVQREHIGITALGLFPVNRATYLTIVGTIITYAVVVLQFNSGCQTSDVTPANNVILTNVTLTP